MATPIMRGTPIIYGVVPTIRPIVNVPGWATAVKVRLRNDSVVRVYVRSASRIECWCVKDTPDGWELVFQQGRNVALNPPDALAPAQTPENRA